ncbi:DNA polymerase III subunit epsilon [Allorhizobium taibaishanense]|nr:DNA polymerase III subunit epsilon [Allorhizobium taibaishanense]OLP48795.1 DNA polymerase III subunit epsilon [Allorhizobium taibaishanense]
MREIVFDTETTGLESKMDRVIEIGGVELFNHFPTGRTFHVYINPADRAIHPDALAVHGITPEFLKDKPLFADIVEDLVAFFDGAKWVAHNATFDMGFINAELERLGRPPVGPEHVIDTLSLARRKHPMGPNTLDALCRRYGIDNSHRTKHGALLDSELLAEVYIEMLGGRQATFGLEQAGSDDRRSRSNDAEVVVEITARPRPLARRLSDDEQQRHAALVKRLGQKAIWAQYGQAEKADTAS